MLDDNMGLQYLAPIALPYEGGKKVEFLISWNSQKGKYRGKKISPQLNYQIRSSDSNHTGRRETLTLGLLSEACSKYFL